MVLFGEGRRKERRRRFPPILRRLRPRLAFSVTTTTLLLIGVSSVTLPCFGLFFLRLLLVLASSRVRAGALKTRKRRERQSRRMNYFFLRVRLAAGCPWIILLGATLLLLQFSARFV